LAHSHLHAFPTRRSSDLFREEPWYDFIGYQSSHSGDLQRSFTWIYDGPPAKEWAEAPRKPVINLEPCYEEHLQTGTDQVFDARQDRKSTRLNSSHVKISY